jgi:hypothetical protein
MNRNLGQRQIPRLLDSNESEVSAVVSVVKYLIESSMANIHLRRLLSCLPLRE